MINDIVVFFFGPLSFSFSAPTLIKRISDMSAESSAFLRGCCEQQAIAFVPQYNQTRLIADDNENFMAVSALCI